MPASTTIEVVGVKQTINSLRKIDPQLQKDFKADATAIAQPAVQAAKNVYRDVPLSGMQYKWAQNGRKIFPFRLDKAIKGVQMKFDTRRKAVGVIMILQKDVATAVWETAGRRNTNKLGASLGFVASDQTRILKPAIEKDIAKVEREIEKIVKDAIRTVERGI